MNDIEEVEFSLRKAELQFKNKDLDTDYYKQLVNKTEIEIMKCSQEIVGLKAELDAQRLLK